MSLQFTPNLLVRLDLTKIYPPFLERVEKMLFACHSQQFDYVAVSGLRDWKEQGVVYAQGRTIPCSQCQAKGVTKVCGHIISKAPPGWSAHQYGIAIDFCKDSDLNKLGLQPDWNQASYEVLANESEKVGLEAGQHWTAFKDSPHIQIPLTKLGIKWPTLIMIHEKGGLPAVWEYLDKFKW